MRMKFAMSANVSRPPRGVNGPFLASDLATMTNRRTIVPLLLLICITGCHTVGRNITGIDNFDRVDGRLYRGAQPSKDGIAELKNRGVQTVIDLRDDSNPSERGWVEAAGMNYLNIPMSATRVEPAKVHQFLDAVTSSPAPIFVHCRQGRDRTGLNVGAYRMAVQDRPRDATLDELYAHGYHWAVFPGIAKFLKTFDPQQYRKQVIPTTQAYLPATSS
jgi:uncharacterized protein (TIGR01244 family)